MHAYASSTNRAKALALLAVVAVVLAVLLQAIFEAVGLGPSWLFSPPAVGSSYALLYLLMDRKAWRWRWLRRLGVVEVPVIEGVYQGELTTAFDSSVKQAQVEIDQTWTGVVVRFSIAAAAVTSTSCSVSAALDPVGHSVARLIYTYRNQARPAVAEVDMGDHDGTAEVTIDAAGVMSGRYFNSRGRQGTMLFKRL